MLIKKMVVILDDKHDTRIVFSLSCINSIQDIIIIELFSIIMIYK
jgi:hypothetical protein